MQLPPSISRTFKVEPGEGGPLALMLGHSFFAGISLVSFYVASTALFLSAFSADVLPYVYLTSAVVGPLAGWVYSRCEKLVSFQALLSGTLIFLIISVLWLRLSLEMEDPRLAAFGLLVWYSVLFALINVELWGAAGRLFTLQQGKRLFGLVATGEIVAATMGGFATPIFIKLNGTPSLLMVSAGSLVFCLVFLRAMIRLYGDRLATPEETRSSGRIPDRSLERSSERFWHLVRNRYIRFLFLLYMTAVTVSYLLEFVFYQQARNRYADDETLARFFGNFTGLEQVLTLILLTFVTSRLITRFGIRISLRVRPVTLLAGSLSLIAVAMAAPEAGLYFWLALSTKLADKVLYRSANAPSFLILYQPLPRSRRLSAQVAIESVIGPIAGGVAGLLLLGYRWLGATSPVYLNILTFGLILVWVKIGAKVYVEYRKTLSEAMVTRTLEGGAVSLTESDLVEVVESRLSSQFPGEVIYALDLLEKANADLEGRLIELLEHQHPLVRIDALNRLKVLDSGLASPGIRSLLSSESDASVQSVALKVLCEIEEAEDVETVAVYLNHQNAEIRAGAVVGLLRSGGLDGILMAGREVISREHSEDPLDRAFVADVLGEVGIRSFYRPLVQLLRDPVRSVRGRALLAAGRVRSPRLWPAVMESLQDRMMYRDAMASLAEGGDSALPTLRATFMSPAVSPELKSRIARVLGRIGTPLAVSFMEEYLDHGERDVRTDILHSLHQCGYTPTGSKTSDIHKTLEEESAAAAFGLALVVDIGEGEPWDLVRRALLRELQQIQRRCLYLLSFLFDSRTLMHANENLQNPSPEQRSYALEVLDTTISRQLKPIVMPLFESSGPAQRLGRLNAVFPQQSLSRARRLLDIAGGEGNWRNPWTRACAIRLLVDQDLRDEIELVIMARPVDEPLTCEVLMWGLRKMAHPRFDELAGELVGRCEAVRPVYAKLSRWKEGDPPMLLSIEKVMVLKSVHVFAGVPEDVLANLSSYLEEIEVPANETVYRKGDTGDTMYIIVDGKAKVHDGDRTFVELGQRDFFGELTTLDPEPHSASVTATEDTRLLGLHREDLYELMSGYPEVLKGIIHELCNRLRGKRSEDEW